MMTPKRRAKPEFPTHGNRLKRLPDSWVQPLKLSSFAVGGGPAFTVPFGHALTHSRTALAGLVFILCLAARGASAQRLPTATAPGSAVTVGGTYSYFQAQYPQRDLGGAGVYVDLDFNRHIGLEAEGRFLRQGQIFGSHESTFLGGPRIAFRRGIFSPYLKALIGNGNLVFPIGAGYGNYLVVAGGAGLDMKISDNFKVRLFDFEYQDWPSFTLGTITPYGVTAGISYQLYHTGGWRRHRYE